ncbi:hypothetical protein [Staphylococcus cohnii]
MNDLGNTVIENFNTYAPSNIWFDWFKILATPIVTLIIGLFTVYITVKNLKRTMLDNLDSKSEWRKTLFKIAGKNEITMDDVFQLRAAVRFDFNNKDSVFNKKTKHTFNSITDLIIHFTDKLVNTKTDTTLFKFNYQLSENSKEMVRTFCRYLLANQWEILQLTPTEQYMLDKHNNKSKVKYSWHQRLKHCILYHLNKRTVKYNLIKWTRKEYALINHVIKVYINLIDSKFNTLK